MYTDTHTTPFPTGYTYNQVAQANTSNQTQPKQVYTKHQQATYRQPMLPTPLPPAPNCMEHNHSQSGYMNPPPLWGARTENSSSHTAYAAANLQTQAHTRCVVTNQQSTAQHCLRWLCRHETAAAVGC